MSKYYNLIYIIILSSSNIPTNFIKYVQDTTPPLLPKNVKLVPKYFLKILWK